MNILEFKERINQHQTHMEDLVLLGRDGLEELNDKIEKTVKAIEGNNSEVNLTTKIDGCLHPDTLVKTTEGDIPIAQIIYDYPNKVYIGYGKDLNSDEIKEVELGLPRVAQGDKNWVGIELDNNYYIYCTEDHPFKIVNGDFIPANELKVGLNIEEL